MSERTGRPVTDSQQLLCSIVGDACCLPIGCDISWALIYGGLNADRFNKGRRVYQHGTVKLTKELSALVFITEAVHNDFAVANHRRIDLILAYTALASLQRAGLFN